MTAAPLSTPGAGDRLRGIAARLGDVATSVRDEAEATTVAVRGIGSHAASIAALAADLAAATATVGAIIEEHRLLLDQAGSAAITNGEALTRLGTSAGTIAATSERIGTIAGQSRLLALNARIEAARADLGGRGFAVVASEMTGLADQTRDATGEIAERAAALELGMVAARAAIDASAALVASERVSVAGLVDQAARQRTIATEVAALTSRTVEQVDEAAVRTGRTASAAGIVGLLARQVLRLADELG